MEKMNNIPGPYIVLAKAHLQNHNAEGVFTNVSKGDATQLSTILPIVHTSI